MPNARVSGRAAARPRRALQEDTSGRGAARPTPAVQETPGGRGAARPTRALQGTVQKTKRSDPRGLLVFDIRTLGAASARSEARTVPAPADLGAGMVRVPEGSNLELEVQLEDVGDGVLVTALVTAPLIGECARCLDEFTSRTQVRFCELFAAQPGDSGDDGYLLDGDLLDIEPALRDALVLELPLSPLCRPDCAGLCSRCGIKLAEAEPGHAHPDEGGVWAVLKDLFGPEQAEERPGSNGRQD
jgi:uncharacterized protein